MRCSPARSETSIMRIRAFFCCRSRLPQRSACSRRSSPLQPNGTWNAAAQAQQLVMAIRAGVSATERLAFERGYYLLDIFIEPAIDAAEKANIDKAKAETDAAFVETIDRLERSGIAEAVSRLRRCARSWLGSPNYGAKEIAHLASHLPRASVPPSIRFTRGCWRCPPRSMASSTPWRMR